MCAERFSCPPPHQLDLNKFLAGKIDLSPRRCCLLVDVLRPTVAMLGGSGVNSNGPTLELVTEEPLWVECDSLRMKQVSATHTNTLQHIQVAFALLVRSNRASLICERTVPVVNQCIRLFSFIFPPQVFANLVKNAIKFVPSGFVRIGASRVDSECVQLWVEDSGPGIPEDKVDTLFNKYTQLNAHDQGTSFSICYNLAIY